MSRAVGAEDPAAVNTSMISPSVVMALFSRNANGVEALSPGLARDQCAYPGERPTENGPTLNGLQPSVVRRRFATTPSGLRGTRRPVSQGSSFLATAGLTDGTPLAFSAADVFLSGGDALQSLGRCAGGPFGRQTVAVASGSV